MDHLAYTLITDYALDHLTDHYDRYNREIDVVALASDAMTATGLSADEVEWAEVAELVGRIVEQAKIDYQIRS